MDFSEVHKWEIKDPFKGASLMNACDHILCLLFLGDYLSS